MKTKNKDIDFKAIPDKVVEFFGNHLYLCMLVICLLSHIVTFSQNLFHYAHSDITGIFVISIALIFLANKLLSPNCNTLSRVVVSVIIIGVVYYFAVLNRMCGRFEGLYLLSGTAIIFLSLFVYRNTEKKEKLVVFAIIAFAFLVRLWYVYRIDIYTYQHDIGAFGGDGHLGYIDYLYSNVKLPDFDPRPRWQFYHPPLHHLIAAMWIGINKDIFGVGESLAREGIQSLTLFYSMVILVTIYLILKHINIKGIPLYTALILVAFHPSFILLSGSVNNDCLSVALICVSLLAALKWSEKPSFKRAGLIGLFVGLAMMAKLSSALVAIPIALILISRYIKDFKKEKKNYTLQFLLLGIIAFPLGLGYQIKNYFSFGVPITYVQELGTDIDQYIGGGSLLQRLFDFSPFQLSRPFLSWASWGDGGYNEYNPLIALFKTSMFEESICEITFPRGTFISFIAYLLFWVSIAIALYATVSMVITVYKKLKTNPREMVLLGSMWLITFCSYYSMCADYPFVCTMSFRYATPLILMGAIFVGYMQGSFLEKKKKGYTIAAYSVLGVSILFAFLSVIAYFRITGLISL